MKKPTKALRTRRCGTTTMNSIEGRRGLREQQNSDSVQRELGPVIGSKCTQNQSLTRTPGYAIAISTSKVLRSDGLGDGPADDNNYYRKEPRVE